MKNVYFQIVLEKSLGICMEYVVEGLRICPQWLQTDLLRALAVLLYENVANVAKVPHLFDIHKVLIQRRLKLTCIILREQIVQCISVLVS